MRFNLYGVFALSVLAFIANPVFSAPPEGKGKPSNGDGDQCNYPSFADAPKDKLRGDEANFYIQYASQLEAFGITFTKNNFGNNIGIESIDTANNVFDENGLDDSIKDGMGNGLWFVEDMTDNQHRTGNLGINSDGSVCTESDCTPVGKRLSAWYEYDPDLPLAKWEHLDEFARSVLTLGGSRREMEIDPTRPPMDATNIWYNNRLYTSWLSTFQRVSGEYGSRKNGSQAFTPPMYLRARVNFAQMQTPGFRVSLWMMPVETGNPPPDGAKSIAYDGIFSNGYEMDIFEFEPVAVIRGDAALGERPDQVCGNAIEFSWINAFYEGKGKTPADTAGRNNFEGAEEGYCTGGWCSDTYANPIPVNGGGLLRPDINEGTHTIEFLWTDKEVVWAFNGEIVLEITDPAMISTAEHYLIASREMTNGLTSGDPEFNEGDESFLPPEPGLYGWNGNSNVGPHMDLINEDKAVFESIEIYTHQNSDTL